MTARRDEQARERILALAHELRTPLTALQIGLGILGGEELGTLSEAQRDLVATLGQEIARLRRLVESSFDTERLGAYSGPSVRERGELGEIVRASLQPIARQAAARGVKLSIVGRTPQPVCVDRMRVSWAVASLAGNALRYAPGGTRVRISVRRRAGRGVVEVRDEGPGIPRAVRNQLEGRGEGHAFTLSMVREIVEAHGGQLRIRAGLPVGSAIELTLPLDPVSTTSRSHSS